MRRAYCSYTAQPNTPETDKQGAAISKVNGLNDETYNNLKRVVSHEKSRSN